MKEVLKISLVFALLALTTRSVVADHFGPFGHPQQSQIINGNSGDHAFDRYATEAQIEDALRTMDPVKLTDVAIHVKEGEAVLHRTCPRMSGDNLMNEAIMFAKGQHNVEALNRLSQAFARHGNQARARELAELANDAPEAARNNPFNQIRNGIHKDDTHYVNTIMNTAQGASIRNDREAMEAMHRAVQNEPTIQDETRVKIGGFLNGIVQKMPAPPAPPAPMAGPVGGNPALVTGQSQMIIDDGDRHGHRHHQPPIYSHRLRANFERTRQGMTVFDVQRHSPLQGVLQPGDTIIEMDGAPVRSEFDLDNHIKLTRIQYINRDGVYRTRSVFIF